MTENNSQKNEVQDRPVRPKSHRILAWIVIVLLLAMYIATLVVAITGGGVAGPMFMACVGASIFLPGALWFHLRLWQISVDRNRKEYEKFAKSGELSGVAKVKAKDAGDESSSQEEADDSADNSQEATGTSDDYEKNEV